jgi:predicted flap endonuclease-1-like 5' DNA nuclease
MDWWWILLILVVVILILWWALRRNADATEIPAQHEEEPVKAAFISPEARAPIAPAAEDDLEIIEGIGPKISSILKSAGITSFAQLAKENPANLKSLLEKAGLRLGDPTTWPQQANLAAAGKMDELQKLQDNLKGGRLVS